MAETEKMEKPPVDHHDEGDDGPQKTRVTQPDAIVNAFDAAGGAPNPWGRGHLRLYLACMIIYLCSTMNGECSVRIKDASTSVVTGCRLRRVSHGQHQRD